MSPQRYFLNVYLVTYGIKWIHDFAVGHARENIALMRKIVYNLLKLDSDVQNMSVRAKQIYYRNNLDAICRLLFEVVPGAAE